MMLRRVFKSMLLAAFAVLIAIPAAAQVQADLGPLHIRIATDPPPRARYEGRMVRPHRDSVWINGYWDRQQDQWGWISGRWEQPSNPRARWINARYIREGCPWYRRRGCAWRYEPAHWSNQQLVDGDDYRRWRNEHGRKRGHGKH
jgi:WXXGXW repeat (2 copies)